MNTRSSQKTISSALPLNILKNVAEIILLMGIGTLGVLLHAKFRIPLKLPGHQGVVYMALLIAGKLLSKKPYAASFSSVGAAVMLLVPLGFKDPFMPLIYLLPGFITDIGFRFGQAWRTKLLLIALVCGISYMTIPLSRIIISTFTGFPYDSFVSGFIWPTFTHFVFGFAGGFAGSALIRLFRKPKKDQ